MTPGCCWGHPHRCHHQDQLSHPSSSWGSAGAHCSSQCSDSPATHWWHIHHPTRTKHSWPLTIWEPCHHPYHPCRVLTLVRDSGRGWSFCVLYLVSPVWGSPNNRTPLYLRPTMGFSMCLLTFLLRADGNFSFVVITIYPPRELGFLTSPGRREDFWSLPYFISLSFFLNSLAAHGLPFSSIESRVLGGP